MASPEEHSLNPLVHPLAGDSDPTTHSSHPEPTVANGPWMQQMGSGHLCGFDRPGTEQEVNKCLLETGTPQLIYTSQRLKYAQKVSFKTDAINLLLRTLEQKNSVPDQFKNKNLIVYTSPSWQGN